MPHLPASQHPAFAMMKGPKQSEALLHKHLCQWMRYQYPGILFRSGFEGLKLNDVQAAQMSMLNSDTGYPDLMIFEPRAQFFGLAIELKNDGAPLYKKDGSLRASKHLENQSLMLDKLKARGWFTTFGQGEKQCMEIIKTYLSYEPFQLSR